MVLSAGSIKKKSVASVYQGHMWELIVIFNDMF